jgi:hypothetical protein
LVEFGDGVRATERSAEAENAGPENEAAGTKKPTFHIFERSEPTHPERSETNSFKNARRDAPA